MKMSAELTFDDLARTLRALAHDLADRAEAGYVLRSRSRADFDQADGLEVGPALDRGESHDRAGR
jgi:hypothetical protein